MSGIDFDGFINELDRQGFNPIKRGNGYTARCPAHDDQYPSLDVDPSKDGKPLTVCRSQDCKFESILDALGLKGVSYEKPVKTPYHIRKGVKVHSPAKLDGDKLVVPCFNVEGKKLGTQTIHPEKFDAKGKMLDKLNSEGLNTKQSFFPFGDIENADCLLFATGYSTTASVYESTGSPAIMALNDGTLPEIVRLLRTKYAGKEFVICADYDARDKFVRVATECNARLCFPEPINGNQKTDFNDVMSALGKSAVCDVIGDARFVVASERKPDPIEATKSKPNLAPARPSPETETVILRSAASIVPRRIDWLWNGWLAVGKLHLLAGAPGTAKTTIALTWSAAISRGGEFPDGSPAKRGKVLIWSSEDDPRDTLIPRLIAAGADLNNIHIVESVNHNNKGKRVFDPSKDFPLLKSAVEQVGNVSFMVIDSVADAVAGDAGKNNQVRRALAPVKEFAEEMGIATLGITHFNKNVTGKAMSRIIDSVAFVGLPRVVMIAFKKRGNGSLIMRAKSNIGPDNGGYEFYTYVEPLLEYDGITANRVGWKGYVEGSADDHLRDAESNIAEPENEQQKAEKFLMDEFSDGMRRESADVIDKAKSLGISFDSLQRARKELGMFSKKINNKWYTYAATSDDARDREEPQL